MPYNAPFFALIKWLIAFLLLIQARFHLTDKLLEKMFKFFKTFFVVLGRINGSFSVIATELPPSLYMARKKFKMSLNATIKIFPVCKSCGSVWKFEDCIEGLGIYKKAKLCPYKTPFRRSHHRQRCNGALLKTVELATKCKIFYPHMTYCYIDLKTSLQQLLLDSEFIKSCELWKTRTTTTGIIKDIYDGHVWNSFLNYEGTPFLSEDNSFAFMINVDWFQPHKHVSYSVGAIYLCVLNLPRTLRYKLKYICLIGIIPGPKEPELIINSYLAPLVQDLKEFWAGVNLYISTTSCHSKVRCALICCSCDLPAGRKVCGFLSHNAALGCSKCKKYFPAMGEYSINRNYSGFDRSEWQLRTNQAHREDVQKLSQCLSKTALRNKESELGCRYSVLLDLEYFDPTVMLVIDPMHCMYLGIAKHFIKKILIGKQILKEELFSIIQDRIDALVVPSDIGRIPHKIMSSFYNLTADQYKNWIVHYSIICLHGILPPDTLECWRHFVLACRILCQPELKQDDVTIADALILQFCRRTERMFGKDMVTPNMHMCCHLKECILNYGPLNHFWLFAFERFNGILGQLPNNNKSIEMQMMKRFLNETMAMKTSFPDEFREDFNDIFSFQETSVGSLGSDANLSGSTTVQCSNVSLPHSYIRCVLDISEMDELKEYFSTSYPGDIEINSTYKQYSWVTVNGKTLGSYKSRSKNSSIVLADYNDEVRPGRINFFAVVSVLFNGSLLNPVLVCLSWFKHHEQKDACGKPVTIWEHNLFDSSSFLFISAVKCRTVSLVDKLDDNHGKVLFVSPYINNYF